MIHFIKGFTQVNCTQTNCIPSFNEALNNMADSVYSMATTHPFFKAELFIIGTNKFAKFFNKAIFENFRYNGADSYAPKVFTRHNLSDTILQLGQWNNVTVSKSSRDLFA